MTPSTTSSVSPQEPTKRSKVEITYLNKGAVQALNPQTLSYDTLDRFETGKILKTQVIGHIQQ